MKSTLNEMPIHTIEDQAGNKVWRQIKSKPIYRIAYEKWYFSDNTIWDRISVEIKTQIKNGVNEELTPKLRY